MSEQPGQRELEAGIQTDFTDRLDYGRYLGLDQILNAQHPLSRPQHHDEMLFIIQHQTSELWFKLIIHELTAAMRHLAADRLPPCLKILARVKQIQRQLFEQWSVLETLTPSEYVQFRGVFGDASGFQSWQYRLVEFLLGNKNQGMMRLYRHDPVIESRMEQALNTPSLYDEFLRFLARNGHAIPESCLERDWTRPYTHCEQLVPVLLAIYQEPDQNWPAYAMCERLVDVEESFQLWRYRHLKTVERIIGYKRGTGGSSGVAFLRRALDFKFFPELLDVRTAL